MKIYNIWTHAYIWCVDGEEFCHSCDGKGGFKVNKNTVDICGDCNGKGKHDWVSKVMKPKNLFLLSKTTIKKLPDRILKE